MRKKPWNSGCFDASNAPSSVVLQTLHFYSVRNVSTWAYRVDHTVKTYPWFENLVNTGDELHEKFVRDPCLEHPNCAEKVQYTVGRR